MANILNIGVRREHLEVRALALSEAGHKVQNALSVTELNQRVREEVPDMVVIGHNIPDIEKRRAFDWIKENCRGCRVIEIYSLLPELMTADAHVCWNEGTDAVVKAVNQAVGVTN
jgi:CheY-like chemotaxis protein